MIRQDKQAAHVRAMFERIAPRYDRMNRLMTLGRDQAWRRYVVQQAALPAGGRLLDVATGTGDIALEALRQSTDLVVVGLDFSRPMMAIGQARPGGERVLWCEADALSLPFQDATFDAVTSGYLARNVGDILRAFREQVRVLKPGGHLVCLDTSPPPPSILRPLIVAYLRLVVPLLGQVLAGDKTAYTYLPESTRHFKTPDELAAVMCQAGLISVRYHRFMFGTIAVHVGSKPFD